MRCPRCNSNNTQPDSWDNDRLEVNNWDCLDCHFYWDADEEQTC